MSKTPIDTMLDAIEWTPVPTVDDSDEDLPYATHSGDLWIAGQVLRCYRLSNGMSVFAEEDILRFFELVTGVNNEPTT